MSDALRESIARAAAVAMDSYAEEWEHYTYIADAVLVVVNERIEGERSQADWWLRKANANTARAEAERDALVTALRERDALLKRAIFAIEGIVKWARRRNWGDSTLNPEEFYIETEHCDREVRDLRAALASVGASQETPSSLFNRGEFVLHSGGQSRFLIDCDALTDADLDALAAECAEQWQWSEVRGVPEGGRRFAAALEQFSIYGGGFPTLIADDVLTTGASMEEQRAKVAGESFGVVIFARSPAPSWVHALFVVGASLEAVSDDAE